MGFGLVAAGLSRRAGDVEVGVAANVSSEDFSLNQGEFSNGDRRIEEGMEDRFFFSGDIGGDDVFSGGVLDFDGAAVADLEIIGLNLSTVDQGEDESIGDEGSKLLEEVESEGGSSRSIGMEESDVGVESGGDECDEAVGGEQCVEVGEQGVDGVERRSSRAAVHGEGVSKLGTDQGGEDFEIESGGVSLSTSE